MAVMLSPHTYTRENIVEIQSHSGHAVMQRIFDLVLQNGIRIAAPGEFTRRAFMNGRICITQAEGICELIGANTEVDRKRAMSLIKGETKTRLFQIRNSLHMIASHLEAHIDFPEETDDLFDLGFYSSQFHDTVLAPLIKAEKQYESSRAIREGVEIVIAGKPNVGKSSLLNQLVEKNRAIVTPFPGTTRDAIDAEMRINGVLVTLTDTAGIHETNDPVEKLGIIQAAQSLAEAENVLFVIDSTTGITEEDISIFREIQEKRIILVQNKIDICSSTLPALKDSHLAHLPLVQVSAKNGTNICQLKDRIAQIFQIDADLVNDVISLNARQYEQLKDLLVVSRRISEAFKDNVQPELISLDIREALDILDNAVGNRISDSLLDEIFQNFCIGK